MTEGSMALIGKEILNFKKVTSTNDVLKRMAVLGTDEGVVVVASQQTKGRGRQEKKWYSPKNKGLYLSVLLRPKLDNRFIGLLSLYAALTVSQAISQISGLKVGVKWPNDILVGDKKVAGILVESSSAMSLRFVIIGVGINIARRFFVRDKLRKTAGSLAELSGKKIDHETLLQTVLQKMDEGYALLREEEIWRRTIIQGWCGFCVHLGQMVSIKTDNGVIDGVFAGVTETGEAVLKTESKSYTLNAGLCSMREYDASGD